MRLATRIAFVRGCAWPFVLVGAGLGALALLALDAPAGLAIAGTCAATGTAAHGWRRLGTGWMRRIVTRHIARHDALLDEGDDEAVRRWHDEMTEYADRYVRDGSAFAAMSRVNGFAFDDRWAEALALVDSLAAKQLPSQTRQHLDNVAAWSLAHQGRTADAVARARANLDAAAPQRPYLLGTLGAALVLDGQYAAALAPLRDAIALGGPRWAQSVRRYYLGEALAALGRLDEARAEYHEAVTIAPKSRWGRRAQERLAAGAPAAYR